MINAYLETDSGKALLAQLEQQYNLPTDSLKTTLQNIIKNTNSSENTDNTSAIITNDVVVLYSTSFFSVAVMFAYN